MPQIKANVELVLTSSISDKTFNISSTVEGRDGLVNGDHVYLRLQQANNTAIYAEVAAKLEAGALVVTEVIESSTVGASPTGFILPVFSGSVSAISIEPTMFIKDRNSGGMCGILVLGDSNTMGANPGPLYPVLDTHPGVYQMGRGTADAPSNSGPSVDRQIIPFSYPVHGVSSVVGGGFYSDQSISFAGHFAERMRRYLSYRVPVCVIHCGINGSRFVEEAQWKKTGVGYTDAISRVTDFMSNPNNYLGCVVFQTGADGRTSEGANAYKSNLAELVNNLRADLPTNARQPSMAALPFLTFEAPFSAPQSGIISSVISELEARRDSMLADLRSLPSEISYTANAQTTNNSSQSGDFEHFSAQSQRRIGAQVFEAYLSAYNNDLTPRLPASSGVMGLANESGAIAFNIKPVFGLPPVDYYEYQFKEAGQAWPASIQVLAANAGEQIRQAGLTNGQAYEIRVRAHNSLGYSPWSETATATPTALPPGAVTGLTLETPSGGNVNASWEAADNATAYEYQIVEKTAGFAGASTQTITARSFSLSGLKSAGEVYQVRVRATNTGGENKGAWSATAEITPEAAAAAGGIAPLTLGMYPNDIRLLLKNNTQMLKPDGTPAVIDGDPISVWQDLSGKNNHAIAPAGKEPKRDRGGWMSFRDDAGNYAEIITPDASPISDAPIGDGPVTIIYKCDFDNVSRCRFFCQPHGWSLYTDARYNTNFAHPSNSNTTRIRGRGTLGFGQYTFSRAVTYNPAATSGDNAYIYKIENGTVTRGDSKAIPPADKNDAARWSTDGPAKDQRKVILGKEIASVFDPLGWNRFEKNAEGFISDIVIFNRILTTAEIATIANELGFNDD